MENQPKPLKTHKNQHGTMKNQSGTIKTNLQLDRVVMGSSGGHRKLPGGSDDFSLQTDRQTLIIIYISPSSSSYFEGASVLKKGQSASLDVLTTVQISARQGQSVCDRFEMIFFKSKFSKSISWLFFFILCARSHRKTDRQTQMYMDRQIHRNFVNSQFGKEINHISCIQCSRCCVSDEGEPRL